MLRLSFPILALLIAGLSVDISAQGSSGSSGSSGSGSKGSSNSASSNSGSSAGQSGSGSSANSGSGNSGSGNSGSGNSGSGNSGSGNSGSGNSGSGNGGSGGNGGGGHSGGSTPKLPTITTKCFKIDGCGFKSITDVSFGNTSLSVTGKFGEGSYRIVNDMLLEVCPPLCLPAGAYMISYGNAGGAMGSMNVELIAPTRPTLVCERRHEAGTQQCLYLHNGGTNNTMQFTIVSPFKQASIIPGIVRLGIGANFTNYMCGPGLSGDCVKDDLGVIPLSMVGQSLYFQSIVLDPTGVVFPVMTSRVCKTTYR